MDKNDIISFDALYKKAFECKTGVIWKDSVAHFVLNSIEECIKMEKQLTDGTYKPRQACRFHITSPKPRDILSISYRDRVYQRSLNDNAIYPQMAKSLIYDNCACQEGKGTDFARRRLKTFLEKYYRKYGTNGSFLQTDIHGYYPNMSHKSVEESFGKHLDDYSFRCAIDVLRTQYSGDVGYDPGSQMVQIAGISVPNETDHFIKERLKIKYYIRYMDDFILIHNDEEYLKYCQEQIAEHLAKLGFTLNKKKTFIKPISEGIMFLGFQYRLTESGKVIRSLNPSNVKRERRRLKKQVGKVKQGLMTIENVNESYKSWKAHASKGNTHKLIQRTDKYYSALKEGLKDESHQTQDTLHPRAD